MSSTEIFGRATLSVAIFFVATVLFSRSLAIQLILGVCATAVSAATYARYGKIDWWPSVIMGILTSSLYMTVQQTRESVQRDKELGRVFTWRDTVYPLLMIVVPLAVLFLVAWIVPLLTKPSSEEALKVNEEYAQRTTRIALVELGRLNSPFSYNMLHPALKQHVSFERFETVLQRHADLFRAARVDKIVPYDNHRTIQAICATNLDGAQHSLVFSEAWGTTRTSASEISTDLMITDIRLDGNSLF